LIRSLINSWQSSAGSARGYGLPPGQPCFCQIEVTLNSTQRVIVDDTFVSQTNDGFPFDAQRLMLQTLVLRCGDFTSTIVGIFGTEL
jgi:hypothetical protein